MKGFRCEMLVFQECCKCWLLSSLLLPCWLPLAAHPGSPSHVEEGRGWRWWAREDHLSTIFYSAFQTCALSCFSLLSRNSEQSFRWCRQWLFSAQRREGEKLKGRQGGEIWMGWKVCSWIQTSRCIGSGYSRVGSWGSLKGEGLFSNCGLSWQEHDCSTTTLT